MSALQKPQTERKYLPHISDKNSYPKSENLQLIKKTVNNPVEEIGKTFELTLYKQNT